MSERKAQLKAKLIDSRRYLDSVLDSVDDRWEAQVYSDGLGWTVRQLTIHLAEADRGHNNQIMNIAEGRDIVPADFDIERFNKRTTEKFTEKSGDQARQDLTTSRAQMLQWFDGLEDEKLDRVGRHASLNMMSVNDIVRLMAAHERGHANDIARTLGVQVS